MVLESNEKFTLSLHVVKNGVIILQLETDLTEQNLLGKLASF